MPALCDIVMTRTRTLQLQRQSPASNAIANRASVLIERVFVVFEFRPWNMDFAQVRSASTLSQYRWRRSAVSARYWLFRNPKVSKNIEGGIAKRWNQSA